MTTQQMRSFITVAELENVSRAAERLHTGQSALSKNIARLEAEVGVPLFVRNGKKIELSGAGGLFLRCCTQTLRSLDSALEEIRLSYQGGDSRIRIGSEGVNAAIMKCITAFRRENPGTEFDMNSSLDRVEHLDINDFDVLVYPSGSRYDKFSGYSLGREKYLLALSSDLPLAREGVATLNRLEGLDYVFLRSGQDSPEPVFSLCAALVLRLGSQCFVDSREMHRQVVSSGIAVGFVPEGEAEAYRNDSRITLLPVADERFSRDMMICFKREKHLGDCARAFRDFVCSYLELDKK